MSKFIKQYDSNHLVSLGEEGFIKGDSSYQSTGLDPFAISTIPTIDFSTIHYYGLSKLPLNKWVQAHITKSQISGKPVIIEEYSGNSAADLLKTANSLNGLNIGGALIWGSWTRMPPYYPFIGLGRNWNGTTDFARGTFVPWDKSVFANGAIGTIKLQLSVQC